MWLRDFHIDGLRLDAVHAIKDLGAHHFLAELKQQVQNLNLAENRNHFLIAECDLNDVRYINPFKKGGYNLDAQWCDEFHHALHALTTGEENGYYSDFGGTGPLERVTTMPLFMMAFTLRTEKNIWQQYPRAAGLQICSLRPKP